jgi:hypothetical protein
VIDPPAALRAMRRRREQQAVERINQAIKDLPNRLY